MDMKVKQYQEIVNLLNNIIQNEKTRANLFSDEKLRDMFINQVNNLLSLEIDSNILFLDKKWAAIFGKSLVNISKQKLKFAKTDNNTDDNIFADYTLLVNYVSKEFDLAKEELIKENEVSEEIIKTNSVLTDEIKSKYISVDKIVAEPELVNKEKEKPNTENSQNTNNGGQNLVAPPLHPRQDPRFYPFKTKPNSIRMIKYLIGSSMVLLAAVVLIFFILGVSRSYDFGKDNNNISKLFNNMMTWNPETKQYNKPFADGKSINLSNLFILGTTPFGNSHWISPGFLLFVTLFFIVYMGLNLFAPAKNRTEEYTISGWTILFLAFLCVMFISMYSQYLSESWIENSYRNHFRLIFHNGSSDVYTAEQFNSDFDIFWKDFAAKSLFGPMRVLAIVAVIITSLIGLFILALFASKPKLDIEKLKRADFEYQKMLSELMQGRKYEMSSSLYESEEFVPKTLFKKRDKKEDKKEDNNEDKK